MNKLKNSLLIIGVLALFILFAGCATLSLDVKVNSDATIGRYVGTIETTSMVYNFIGGQLKSGFDSELFDYNEEWTGDKVTITVKAKKPLTSTDLDQLRIERLDDKIIYEDSRMIESDTSSDEYSDAMLSSLVFNYYLEMPGDIISSNADKVNGNKAEWHLSGSEVFNTKIYAESEVPMFSLPGFGGILAIVGLLTGIALFCCKKKFD